MSPLARCLLLSLVALPALPDDVRKSAPTMTDRVAEMLRMEQIELRAFQLRPHRIDTPMREINLSDGEVREIEAIAGKYAMHSMLNISPVIAGCACEEGPLCTDQVYVVATTPDETVGLQLSRVRNAWTVGPVQQWWLQFDKLRARKATMDYAKYVDAKNRMLLEFPMCALKDGAQRDATTAQFRDTHQ
jgi:hypothetical protein